MFTTAFLTMGLLHFSTKFLMLFVLQDQAIFKQIPTSFAYGYSLVLFLASKHLYSKSGLMNLGSMIHVLLFVSMTVFFVSLVLFIRSTGDYSFLDRHKWTKFLTVPLILYYGIRTSLYHWKKSKVVEFELPYFHSVSTATLLIWVPLIIAFPLMLAGFGEFVDSLLRIIIYLGFMGAIVLVVRIGFVDYQSPKEVAKAQITKKSEEGLVATLTENSDQTYEKSALTNQELDEISALLDAFISKKGFVDSELTLDVLAQRIGKSKHHISQCLNVKLKKTYYQFINEARIEHFIELLESRPQDKVMDLALLAGFLSKSTFMVYFKKATGLTPTEYKRANGLG